MKLFSEYANLRKEVYVLFFGRVATNMGALIFPMLTLILNNKLGMNASSIALLFFVFSICSLPVSLLGGKLADTFNKRNLIILCDLVTIVTYIICSFVPISFTTICLIFVASLFQTVESPAYDALLADLTTSSDRERAYSLNYLGMNLGLILAPTIGGLLFENYLNIAFLINAGSIATSTLLIFFFIKDISIAEDTSEQNAYEKTESSASTLSILKQRKSILLFTVIGGFEYLIYSQFNYLIPLNLSLVHGGQGAIIFGMMTSVNCIVVVVLTPILTKVFKNIRDLKKYMIGVACILGGLEMYIFIQGMIPMYYVSMVIFTVGEIFVTLAMQPYLMKRIPASHRGRINSVVAIYGSLFSGIFQVGIGSCVDWFGVVQTWYVIGAIGVIEMILLIFLMKKDRQEFSDFYQVNG